MSTRRKRTSNSDFRELAATILQQSDEGTLISDYLRTVMGLLIEYAGCSQVRITIFDLMRHYRFTRTTALSGNFHFSPVFHFGTAPLVIPSDGSADIETFERLVFFAPAGSPQHTGVLVTDAAAETVPFLDGNNRLSSIAAPAGIGALMVLPIRHEEEMLGILTLVADVPRFFDRDDYDFFQNIATVLGIARAHRQAKFNLRERIKELSCVYQLTKLGTMSDRSLDDLLREAAALVPAAFLFPGAISCRIVLDQRSYTSQRYTPPKHRLSAEIRIGDIVRGMVEVSYSSDLPTLDKGPFLKEEESLIEAVAKELSAIIEKKEAEEQKETLQRQLLHADRLVTVGQLAAGMAHEINEPLGSILGFAQLIQKDPSLSEQVRRDLDKIIKAAIHARDTIRKLMFFSRQMPPQKRKTDLNERDSSALDLLEPRIRKSDIRLVTRLEDALPPIIADQAQIHQVIVNLVVNAVQAMERNGTLTIETRYDDRSVLLSVEDTGCGMTPETKEKIFLPFFTTKEIGEGTGLGLPVVLGIVTAHGGRIEVESIPGKGSRFTVILPKANHLEEGEYHA